MVIRDGISPSDKPLDLVTLRTQRNWLIGLIVLVGLIDVVMFVAVMMAAWAEAGSSDAKFLFIRYTHGIVGNFEFFGWIVVPTTACVLVFSVLLCLLLWVCFEHSEKERQITKIEDDNPVEGRGGTDWADLEIQK